MFETTIAGSLPKPAWLAEPNKLWAPWRLAGAALDDAKRDATLLALKLQEDCGIDVVTDGEQSRQHFVHGFLEFVDGHRFRAQGRDRDPRRPLQGDGADGDQRAAPQGPRARARGAARARPYQPQAQVHAAGTDDHHRHHRGRPLRRPGEDGDGFRRPAQRRGARARSRRRRRHPVRRAGVQRLHGARSRSWGIAALHRAIEGRRLRHRRPHLLRLRHQGQHRLEGDARRRMAAIRGRFFRRSRTAASIRSRSNAATPACP